ncbi:MAG: zinc-binding dehydrogenase, partial [Candidatus Heimdallarchaeota archaeon]|nr:zinc-binding dehydrogenase [Candidatus Heimdallarchaeota archaeon]MCK4955655.1 zinc-binding dehydrogenase [Candidatus Heimdallarchaeota archaeon]
LGHECVCEIVETGENVTNIQKGQRAVVQKATCCILHHPENLCHHCSQGNFWLCERVGQYVAFSPYDAAGGWSTGFCYHEDQLVALPDSITSDQAVLIEPLACSLRAILRHTPKVNDKVLIIGAGTIGLCTLASLKAIQPECDVTVLARHSFQAEFAGQLGASDVIDEKNILSSVEEKTNAILYKGILGNKTLIGGFDVIYDCVGTAKTIHNALRWARGRGVVVILGIDLKQGKLDHNPIWSQEVDLIGSMVHGLEEWKGKKIDTFEIVIDLLEQGKIPNEITNIITHRYSLSDYKEAIKTALNKKKYNSVEVIFDYEL